MPIGIKEKPMSLQNELDKLKSMRKNLEASVRFWKKTTGFIYGLYRDNQPIMLNEANRVQSSLNEVYLKINELEFQINVSKRNEPPEPPDPLKI